MSVQWSNPPSHAWMQLADVYTQLIIRGVQRIAQARAVEIEAWMKINAPWTDRTSNARQTLTAEAEMLATQAVQVTLAHGVEYGIFLELAHAGTYAIIGPALDHWTPIIWHDVQQLLS